MSEVRYPDVRVKLTGSDGNAFAVIGSVSKALRRNGCSADELDEFTREAMSGDYNNVLQTCMRWVTVS